MNLDFEWKRKETPIEVLRSNVRIAISIGFVNSEMVKNVSIKLFLLLRLLDLQNSISYLRWKILTLCCENETNGPKNDWNFSVSYSSIKA